MMEGVNKGFLREFLRIGIRSAQGAGAIIKEVHASGKGRVMNKDGTEVSKEDAEKMRSVEVLTEADGKAQHFIGKSIKSRWPTLTIVGEEDNERDEYTPPAPESSDWYERNLEKLGEYTSDPADMQEYIVWVDPLDGTKEFACGDLRCVTTLIGLSYKGQAIAGIITEPFRPDFGVHSTFGLVGHGVVSQSLGEIKPRAKEPPFVITASKSKKPLIEGLIAGFTPDELKDSIRQGGSGCKLISLLEDKADVMVMEPTCGSRWDICAGDAILQTVGGALLQWDGQRFPYVLDIPDDYTNVAGCVASPCTNLAHIIVKKTQS